MSFLLLIAGFVILFFSGDWLVKASVNLARHFNVSTLVIGVTVVAFGTSAPELLVSLKAVFSDSSDISIGNVVGSNIANIALVLGLVSIVFPVKVKRKAVWIDWLVMMVASVGLYIASINNKVSFVEGVIFLVLLSSYLLFSVWKSRKETKENTEEIQKPDISLLKAFGFFLLSTIGLYFGADWLIRGAKDLAINFGISERVVGLTVVAFGTSVPELATSLIAAIKKESDISIGNIIGSNIFNIWAVLGLTSVIKPISVSNELIKVDYSWMVGIAILLLVLLLPLSKGVISRWKGVMLLLLYVTYIYILFI
ncbi:calcium/sodium antiporter [Carboxylicivirga sp. N1Y90]|uniref:calcium/sodium antiporter n=1 Tax=Carboxylicivirga fragile TaxID=3417571 RepID=UPI003D333B87